MTQTVGDTGAMLAGMRPVLREGRFVFCTTTEPGLAERARTVALGAFREAEGDSFILEADQAAKLGFDAALPMAWIELQVFSALDGVGLTAAVAAALAAEQIPCNVVAAFHHDHVFVPADHGQRALGLLQQLQARSAQS